MHNKLFIDLGQRDFTQELRLPQTPSSGSGSYYRQPLLLLHYSPFAGEVAISISENWTRRKTTLPQPKGKTAKIGILGYWDVKTNKRKNKAQKLQLPFYSRLAINDL